MAKRGRKPGKFGSYTIVKPDTPNMFAMSLGWGVQSYTLAEMIVAAKRGCSCELCTAWNLAPLARITHALHSDTLYERAATYAFREQRTPALEAGGLKVVTLRAKREPKITYQSSGYHATYTLIPAYSINKKGKRSMIARACTGQWKIQPIEQYLIGLFRAQKIPKPKRLVELTIGISYDEWMRVKQSDKTWIEHAYPLVDRKLTRDDCTRWLIAHGLPVPSKSSCVMCPYRSKNGWRVMKQEEPEEFARAVELDNALREGGKHRFVHMSYRPLAEVVGEPLNLVQGSLFEEDEDPLATCDSGYCFQ